MKIQTRIFLYFGPLLLVAIMSIFSLNYLMIQRGLRERADSALKETHQSVYNSANALLNTAISSYLKGITEKNLDIVTHYYNEFEKGNLSEIEAKGAIQQHCNLQKVGNTGYLVAVEEIQKDLFLVVHPFLKDENCTESEGCQEWYEKRNGYVEYDWKNPEDNSYRRKVAYIAEFKKWNWIFGATSYKDEFINLIDLSDLKKLIKPIRIHKSGYFFVFNNDLRLIIHPELEGKSSKDLVTPDGVEILRAMVDDDDGFISYRWKNPSENKFREKYAYVNKLEDYNWYIGGSGYTEEIYEPILIFKTTTLWTVLLSAIALFVLIILLSKKITRPLEQISFGINIFYNKKKPFKWNPQHIDEIDYLGNAFVKMTTNLQSYIEERLDLENKLNQSRKMDAVGQLAGGIAHDYNNMLTGILSSVEDLQGSIKDKESLDSLNIIKHSALRTRDLTKNLLNFSRQSINRFSPQSIHSIIYNTSQMLERSVNKSIEIKCDFNSPKDIVIGDSSQLQNVFINLGINASHAMANSGKLTFRTKYTNDNCETIIIEIVDTGCGIPDDIADKIFNPFFTTKNQGEGTGFGLATAYAVIEQHKGTISFKTKIGTGTTFRIELPLSNLEVKPKKNNHPNTNVIRNKTILIIDDENVVRKTITKILEKEGASVLIAENGKQGVELYKEKSDSIDLVLLDMIMPIMDGEECFIKLKEINPNIKVIVASGYSKGGKIEKMESLGLSGFIAKPYKKVEILNTISELEI